MIFKSQSSVSPKIEIAISGVPVNYLSLQRISMSLHENQHDLVKIAMSGVPSGLINDYVDAPVSISWYQGSAGHEFRGYIVFVEPEHINRMGMVNDSPLQQVVLTCFGASFDMRGKRVQVWESPTLYSIVDKLSKKYKFSYSIPNSTFKYIRLTQHNESDWEFLARVVDDLGYSMAFHGTHLHVWDRHRSLGRQTSLHKLESLGTNSDVMETPGRILSFKAYIGAVTPSATSSSNAL